MSKVAYVLVATQHGSMIVNRFDYVPASPTNNVYGLGYRLLENGVYAEQELNTLAKLLFYKKNVCGDGTVVLDIGANIGTHTVSLSKFCTGWGKVIAYEAQPRVFYALAGNIALNNCFNAEAHNVAVGDKDTEAIRVPYVDYTIPTSFASLELRKTDHQEAQGQKPDYTKGTVVEVVNIDMEMHDRLDLMKIDVEGMEYDVIEGAERTIKKHHPIIFYEHIKCDRVKVEHLLRSYGYSTFETLGNNTLALTEEDAKEIQITKETHD